VSKPEDATADFEALYIFLREKYGIPEATRLFSRTIHAQNEADIEKYGIQS